MKYWMIVKSGIERKRIRTIMTVLSIAVAFTLFSLGRSVAVAFNSEIDYAGKDRLIVSSRLSFTDGLPLAHKNRIETLDGVKAVAYRQWFGGTYIERANFFPKWPIPPEYLDIYTELSLSESEISAFKNNIQGMIAGKELADKFSWKIGDRIPIIPDIWPKKGGGVWEFDLVGIFTHSDGGIENEAYINWEYFDEAREFETGKVGTFVVQLENSDSSEKIAQLIDDLFINSQDETKTSTEEAFAKMFAEQTGDIGLIVNSVLAASFFTILLLTSNTMSQAIRERTSELGILKSIGYSDQKIMLFVILESMFICVFGSLIGIMIAFLIFPIFSEIAGGFGPNIEFSFTILLSGILLAILMAFISGIFPAYSAMKLKVVDALRMN